jgi:TP901 family phage tail tape measure protein
MSDQIIIPVSADTSQMERQIQSAASNARVNVRVDLNAAGLENFSRPLGKLTGQADEFSKSMDAANARVLAFGASVGVVNAISNGFKELVKSTIEVEKSLTEISAVGGKTFSDIQQVSAGLFSVAKSTGTSFKDAAEATLEFSRQGKTLAESLEATKAALVLTRTTGIDAAESIKGLTATVNSFSDAGLTMTEIVNKMAAVDAKFAVNSKDLIEGISRSASVAQEAGVSFDQLSALITTLQEKTGRGGAVIGNSLKSIFTRVQKPEILADLRNLGIAVQDMQGNMLPAVQILKNLANEFEGMDKNLSKSVLLKVGGGFQIDKLAAALKDLKDANGTYERSLATGLNAGSEAFDRIGKLNQTLGTSFDNLLTSAKEFGSNIGQITFSKQFTDILQNGSSLIENLNKAIFGEGKDSENQGSKIGKAVLSGIGGVLSGPGVALGLGIFLKLSGDFVKFFGSATQTLLGLTTKTKEEESIQKSITNVLTNNFDIQERLLSLEGDKVAQANLLLNIYTKVAQQAEKTASLSKSLSPALYEGGVRLASGNLQIKGATSAAGGYVPNLADAIRNERQQAPSAAQIIVDHNFPMGGGQRGTMVYNSHETRISNFNNSGGDAIIPNYPVSAADGYVPNFAKSKTPKEDLAVGGKGELLIDARKVPLAGITFAGEQNYLARAKGKEITNSLLKDYVGSPFFDKLREYDKIAVTNVPVGNVYRFRQGLKDKEENIKADFVSRLNDQLRPQLISFISSEIANLGLKPGKGLDKNLSNLKLNILGSSAAGYILEEIVKAPTLTSSEDVAKYAAQSEKSYFDIYGLNPEDAEAYGLPKQRFEYADVKLGQKELSDTLTKKFLNQAIYEGGGANKLKNAAKGYVPNFASKKLSPQDLRDRRSLRRQQPNEYIDFIELQNEPSAYITAGNIGSLKQIGKFSDLQVSAIDILQSSIGEPISPNARISLTGEVGAYNIEKFKNLSPSSLVNDIDSIKIERGSDNRDDLKKMFVNIGLDNPSANLLDASKFEILNARTKKQPTSFVAGNIFEWAINSLVSDNFEKNNLNWDFEKTNPLTKKLFNLLNVTEAFGDAKLGTGGKNFSNFIGKHIIEPQGYKTAAKGYIPNFATSNIQADILTANPMIGQMSLDSFIEKYIANNPGTGLRGTGGFVDAAVYQGENLSPEAKNDFIMSMLGINWLATFNRDKEANLARQSLINQKAKSSNRFRDEKVVDLANLLGGKEGGPNKYRSNAVVDPNNVVEGAFSGSVKELKYEDLHSLADNIFSKAGVADVFNRDIVATMYKVAMQMHKTKDNPVSTYSQGPYNYTPDAAAIGHEFDYLNPKLPKVENEYSIIKRATQQLRPILIQGLLENDKNAQALLLNPPKQDLSVVGDSSKYLALLDPNAANLRKYISGYLLNPSIEPLKERSEEAISNKINLTSIRSFLDEYHQASFSRKPVSLDTLKSMRAKAASNSQLRKFFSEGPEGAFKEVSMGYRNGKKTGLTAWWNENLNQLTVDNINNILSASINREGIFQLSNLDFKFNGVAPLSGSFDGLHTFANSPDLPSSETPQQSPTTSQYPPQFQQYIQQRSIGYGQWVGDNKNGLKNGLKFDPLFQKYLSESNLKTKYNPTTKRVDIINAVKGFIPNFAELNGEGGGLLYKDPNYEILGSGTSGMFLAPHSTELMGQKIFFNTEKDEHQDKIKHEYHVNKSLRQFEKDKPDLFATNAISFTEVGDFLTKNGLLIGFQREVIRRDDKEFEKDEREEQRMLSEEYVKNVRRGSSVDEFATRTFPNRSRNTGDENVVANYAYHLSDFMAQAGAKHVVDEYRKLNKDDSFRLQDVFAGNFKVNAKMQEFLIAKTLQRLPLKKKIPTTFEPYSELKTIFESGGMDIFNHEIGSQGGRNIMFDTMGFSKNAAKEFSKNAAKGFVPNFADSSEIVFSGTKITKEQLKKFLSSKLDSDAINYINNTAPNRLTNQLRSNYLDGALGFSADDKSLDKFRNYTITAANGYIPNFASKKKKTKLDPSIRIQNAPYEDQDEDEEDLEIDPNSFEAIHKGYIVGSLFTSPSYSEKNGVYIDKIEVDEEHRRKGIAKALYTHLVKSLPPGTDIQGELMPQHMTDWHRWGENNLNEEENKKLKTIKTLEGLKMIYPQLSRIDLSRDKAFRLRTDDYEIDEKTPKTDPTYKEIVRLAKYSSDANLNLVTYANNGFIPNFAAGIQEAIVREKMATGLPDSMIKVSVDNRAKNDTYNPSGLIVTNKIDEPHGASDVSSKRMFEAYGNAGKGFIPNFSEGLHAARAFDDATGGGILPTSASSSTEAAKSAAAQAQSTTTKLIDKLNEFIKSIAADAVAFSELQDIVKNYNKALFLNQKGIEHLSEQLSSVANINLNKEQIISNLNKLNTQNQTAPNQTPLNQTPPNQTPPNQTPPNQTPPNPQNEVNKKSFTELAGQLFALQTGLSFLSGALGSLGEKGELAGKIVNDLGQSIYAFTQGGQLLGSLKESKSVNAALEATKGNKFGVFGGLGTAADAAKAAGGGLGGSIGALGAAVSSLAVPAAFIYGLHTAGNTLNSFFKLATDQSTKTAVALGKLTEVQKQYNIGLTDQQKAISDSFVKKVGNVEASTAWDRFSFTFDKLTSAPKTVAALKSLNQETSFNTPLLQSISQITSDDAYKQFKSQTGDNKKSLTNIQDDLNSKKIEQLKRDSMVAKQKSPEEIEAFIAREKRNTIGGFPEESEKKNNPERYNFYNNQLKEKVTEFSNYSELDLDKLNENFQKLLENAEKQGKSTYAVQKTLEASLGVSISYLKTELNLRQQIAQSILETKTSQEYSLDYEKELLTTSDQRKDSINLELQLIQKNRDLRKEKLTLAAGSFETELTNSLQSKPGGISTDQYNNIKNSYQKVLNSIQNGNSNEGISNTLKGILNENGLDEESAVAQQLVKSLENQLNTKDLLNSKDQQALLIADKINQFAKLKNYLITSEKEKLDNILKISEKELSIAKERSQIKRSIQDVTFERSILSLSPAQQELARGQYTPQQNYNKAIDDIRNRNLEADSQTRRNLISLIQQKNPNLNVDEIAELPNQNITQLQKSVREAYRQEAKNKEPENREDYINKIKEKALTNPETSLFAAAGVGFKNDIDAAGTKLKTDFLEIINKAAQILKIPQPEANPREVKTSEPAQATPIVTNPTAEAAKKLGLVYSASEMGWISPSEEKAKAAINAATVARAPKEQKILADETLDTDKQKRDLAIYQNYTFKGGAESSMQKMQDEIDSFSGTLGKQIPNDFRDAMAGAMKGLADTTKPLKDSLLNVALAFTQKIQDALFTNLANQITAPLTGAIAGHASGGPITGGSGAKDDVPAMLMGGEYVIKKSAAQKYGIGYLNRLNNETVKKFADGGSVGIELHTSGGFIKGGSGTKDDVPALLTGGEFVIKKSAAKKYGVDFLNLLNSGKIKKYAAGGPVQPYSDFVEKNNNVYDPNAAATKIAYGSTISGNLMFDKNGAVTKIAGYTAPANTSGKEQSDLLRAQTDFYAKNRQTGERGFYMPGTNGLGAIMGQQSLLKFATQQVNAGEFDKFSSARNSASINIGAGSRNLSLSALRDKNNLIGQSYTESKNKALEFYLGGVQASSQKSEQDYKEQERYKKEVEQIETAKKTAQREMYQGVLRQLATSVVVAGISYGIQTAAQGVSNARMQASQANLSSPEAQASIAEGKSNLDQGLYAYQQKTGMSMDEAAKAYNYQGAYNKLYSDAGSLSWGQAFSSLKGAWSGGTIGGENRGGLSNFFNSKGSMDFGYLGTNNGVMKWNGSNYQPMTSSEYNSKFIGGVSWGKPNSGGYYPIQYNRNSGWTAGDISKSIAGAGRHAAGGYIAGSSGTGDNVPSMLSDGEFVISKQAASQVGYNKLNQINSGNVKSDSSDMIVKKLDELLDKLNAVGTVNITVNNSKSGSSESNDTKDTSRDKMAGSSDSDQKVLAQKIKLAVIQVLSDEKRLGGMLR